MQNLFVLVRGVLVIASLALFIALSGIILDVQAGYSLANLASWNYTTTRFLTDMTNRGLNQVLATTFTVVAIAVPLTANLYSLKFLEFFIKDRVNAFMLTLVVCADVTSFWMIYSIKETALPVFGLHVAFSLLLICLVLIFPYLYYVFQFLHPNTLLQRLETEIISDMETGARHPARARRLRREVAEGIEHLANVAIRSIDRLDRNTAIESIFSLERVGKAYWQFKAKLPETWFVADPNLFLGFSSAAVEELTASHNWLEMKLFYQFRQIMSAAIPKTHDVVSTAAKTLRKMGLEAHPRFDSPLRELVVEYFNTFVRLSIQRKDPRSVFIIFDQYRTYAEALNADAPDVTLEIAYYFEYYGQVARDSQLPFVVEAIAHDLGTLVQRAWEAHAPNAPKLLERFLHYDPLAKTPLAGVKKAHALIGSYFLLAGHTAPAHLIRQSFAGLDPAFLNVLTDDLLHIKREKYWEINERRINMDYVPDAQREHLRAFLDSLSV